MRRDALGLMTLLAQASIHVAHMFLPYTLLSVSMSSCPQRNLTSFGLGGKGSDVLANEWH